MATRRLSAWPRLSYGCRGSLSISRGNPNGSLSGIRLPTQRQSVGHPAGKSSQQRPAIVPPQRKFKDFIVSYWLKMELKTTVQALVATLERPALYIT